MHSQYLMRLFLDNGLSEGRYPVGGKPVVLSDISVPVFRVGTVTDHVAPWRSIYKLHHLTEAELTFVLTSGGHNVGIVSPPGHPHRPFQLLTRPAVDGAGRLAGLGARRSGIVVAGVARLADRAWAGHVDGRAAAHGHARAAAAAAGCAGPLRAREMSRAARCPCHQGAPRTEPAMT